MSENIKLLTITEYNYLLNSAGSNAATESILVEIPTIGWSTESPYTITINVDGIVANYSPIFYLVPAGEEPTEDEIKGTELITDITTEEGSITIEVSEVPTTGFTIALCGFSGKTDFSPADYAELKEQIKNLETLAIQLSTLGLSVDALTARLDALEGGGSSTTGFYVDFTNADTRERWSDDDWHSGSYGDFYFEINGIQYALSDISVLTKYTNVTSFNVMAVDHSGGSSDFSMTYTMGGSTYIVTWNCDEENIWKGIPITGDIVVSSFGYSSCLTGDSMITMADGTEKRLDSLDKGDMVLAVHPETHELVSSKLLYCNRLTAPQYVPQYDVWTFEDGSVVKTAKRHRLYNVEHQAMVYMDEWQIGEHAYNKNGEYIALVNHEVITEEVRHFTLFTEHQNYFVNGILAGNRHTPEILL